MNKFLLYCFLAFFTPLAGNADLAQGQKKTAVTSAPAAESVAPHPIDAFVGEYAIMENGEVSKVSLHVEFTKDRPNIPLLILTQIGSGKVLHELPLLGFYDNFELSNRTNLPGLLEEASMEVVYKNNTLTVTKTFILTAEVRHRSIVEFKLLGAKSDVLTIIESDFYDSRYDPKGEWIEDGETSSRKSKTVLRVPVAPSERRSPRPELWSPVYFENALKVRLLPKAGGRCVFLFQ